MGGGLPNNTRGVELVPIWEDRFAKPRFRLRWQGSWTGREAILCPDRILDSKLMNMLTSRELAVRLQESKSNIATYCVCPGFCNSRLGRNVHVPFYLLPLRFLQR